MLKILHIQNPLLAGYYKDIAVKEENAIPRICNWRVVAVKPKFRTFMSCIFFENACSNLVPTPDEVAALDLCDIQVAHPHQQLIQMKLNQKTFQVSRISPQALLGCWLGDHQGFLSFSVSDEPSTPVANVSFVQDVADKSMPCIVEVSNQKGNDEHQTSTFHFDQQSTSPIQMNFAHNDQNIDVSEFEVEDQIDDTLKNQQEMKDVSEHQSFYQNIHHTAETNSLKKLSEKTDEYKDKESGTLIESQHPFNVEFAQDIMQQESDSLDKAKNEYISENDDPQKPKGQFTSPPERYLVNIE
ncbi:hypothetical protein RDI58_014999 [Solanum bulbocastanum]|uniref:Uncharacterized protein n=1 Tax=Solanum bulbocastanum TaxID=147425 RepID=A0AAN8YB47_SOLBU